MPTWTRFWPHGAIFSRRDLAAAMRGIPRSRDGYSWPAEPTTGRKAAVRQRSELNAAARLATGYTNYL